MVKTYNTLSGPFSSHGEETPAGTPSSLPKHHLHQFPSSEALTDETEFPLPSPFTPADYKSMAMEMAYLTPRRKGPASDRRLGLSVSGGGVDPSLSFQPEPRTSDASPSYTVDHEERSLLAEGTEPSALQTQVVRRRSPSSRPSSFSSSFATTSSETAAAPSKLTLLLFAASILFLFADQNLLAPNLTAVARDMGFDDAERDLKLGGQIPFAFFVVGGAVSIVVGPMADVMNRKTLYVCTCLVGIIPCLLTYWVVSFNQFFLLRTLTGVAVGGAFPLIYSLAADITTPDQRALASSLITISMGVGGTLGQGVAGFVGPVYGWRMPFVIIALPSLLVIALVMLTMEEPPRSHHIGSVEGRGPRGASEALLIRPEEAGEAADEEWGEERGEEENREEERGPSLARLNAGCSQQLRKFMDVFVIRTNLLAFCQSMPGCLPWGVTSAFLTDFLHEQRGMTVEKATALMFIFGLGCFLGNLAGGVLGQWAYNRSKEGAALLMAASTALGIIPMAWLINAKEDTISTPNGGFTFVAAVVAFSGGIAAFTGPLIRAFVMQVNSSRNRGTVFSVFMVADDLGKGLGPAMVSLLIPSWGRLVAFNISLGGWMMCAVFLGLLALTIRADEEALLKQLSEEARHTKQRHSAYSTKKMHSHKLSHPRLMVHNFNGVESVLV